MTKEIDNYSAFAEVNLSNARSENESYEDYKKSYASKKELGGGVVLTCIHEIDYMYWLFGDIKEVFSLTGKFSD